MNFARWAFSGSGRQNAAGGPCFTGGAESAIGMREFESMAMAAAGMLSKISLTRGQRVLVMGENSAPHAAAYFGVIASGATCVPLNPAGSESELRNAVRRLEPAAAFASAKVLDANPWMKEETTCFGLADIPLGGEGVQDGGDFCDVDEKADTALMLATSGSSGTPKFVMLSHRNLRANAESIIEYLKLTSSDSFLQVLPHHYSFGLSWLHTLTRVGARMDICNSFMFPQTAVSALQSNGCTGFAGVPATFQILLQRTKFASTSLPRLRFLAQAGGKLRTEYISQLAGAFKGKEIYIMYGQTEATARLSYLPPGKLAEKLGSIGRGIPGVRLRVLDEGGNDVPAGQTGEIVAEGDNIMQGYFDDEEATAQVLRGGRLYTRDLATVDEDGFIFVQGRVAGFIKSGGVRISPYEIEEAVAAVPGVKEAAVVAIDDAVQGEAPAAVVAANGSVTETMIMEYCRKKLESHKVPRKVVFVDALPRTPAGKVAYSELKRIAESHTGLND